MQTMRAQRQPGNGLVAVAQLDQLLGTVQVRQRCTFGQRGVLLHNAAARVGYSPAIAQRGRPSNGLYRTAGGREVYERNRRKHCTTARSINKMRRIIIHVV